jgi:hypothetical protein
MNVTLTDLLAWMPPDAIVATIDHIWGNTEPDNTEATALIEALWQKLLDMVDYYDALDLIETKMSQTSFLDFCETMDAS